MLGKKKHKTEPVDLLERGDIYYTTGRGVRGEYGDIVILPFEDLKLYHRDGTVLYEVCIRRKMRLNVDTSLTEID